MAKRTYAEKLRDPRWQKKRLEIMQRANFKCELCGCDDETLNIHHGFYEYGYLRKYKQPWDYPSKTLWCLCENCHLTAHQYFNDIHEQIAMFHINDLELLSWILNVVFKKVNEVPFDYRDGILAEITEKIYDYKKWNSRPSLFEKIKYSLTRLKTEIVHFLRYDLLNKEPF